MRSASEIWVATEAIREAAAVLHQTGIALQGCAEKARALADHPGLVPTSFEMMSLLEAAERRMMLLRAAPELQNLGLRASLIGRLLVYGAFEYEQVEGVITLQLSGKHEYWAGVAGGMGRQVFFGNVLAALLLAFGVQATEGLWGPALNDLVSQEWAIAVRLAVDGSDEMLDRLLGRDSERGSERGIDGASVLGMSGSIAALRTILQKLHPDFLAETLVQVHAERVTEAKPPRDFADLVARIPQDDARIRIERFQDEQGPVYLVYLSGTADQGILPKHEAWDMTSNLSLMEGQRAAMEGRAAASQRAAELAMAEAGITAGDRVILAGYSQGGLAAVRIAESGQFSQAAVVTAGSPVSHIRLETVPVIELLHSDDIVPALSGIPVDHSGTPRTVLVREAFAGQPGQQEGLAAHHIDRYQESARGVDFGQLPGLREILGGLRSPSSEGDTGAHEVVGTGQEWTARRVSVSEVRPTIGRDTLPR